MALFKDLLKKWFYTQGTQAASATARIPLLNASGEPIGCDTMKNMAKILNSGSMQTLLTSSDNLNNIKTVGVYIALNTDNPQNTPQVNNCYNNIIWCLEQGGATRVAQVLYSFNLNAFFYRTWKGADPWNDWVKINTDIPDFYKNYTSLNALTNALVAQNALSIGNVMVVTNADSYTRFWPADRALESGIANIAVGAGIIENGRTLIIAKDTTTKKWAESNVAGGNSYLGREAAVADFNGRTNTNKILETLGANAPAATYCHTYHPANVDSADANMGAGRWWLPSLGELAMIWAHVREINFVLSAIGGTQIPVGSGWMWSSTEYSATYAWNLSTNYGTFYYSNKTVEGSVRPVSAFY